MEQTIALTTPEKEKFCLYLLSDITPSYAILTHKMEEPLRTTLCVFYLIMRGLDTIEDDTTIDKTIRVEAMKIFPAYLDHLKSHFPVGTGHGLIEKSTSTRYVELIEKFDIVLEVFGQFTIENKNIIRDVIEQMAKGMIKYINSPIETMADYDEYCYHVTGYVLVGILKLFRSNFAMNDVFTNDIERLAISTGLFLQKVNIIADIFEDVTQPEERVFYPKVVWGKYVANFRDLIDENHLPQALTCVKFLINEAFRHFPETVECLSHLSRHFDITVFRYTAIPIALAVGTADTMFNNASVFNSRVKLTKIENVYIFESVTDITSALGVIKPYLTNLSEKVLLSNSFQDTKNYISESLEFVNKYQDKLRQEKPSI